MKLIRNMSGEALLLISGLLFGMVPSIAKMIYAHGGNCWSLLPIRFLFGAALFFAILRIGGQKISVQAWELKRIFLLSLPQTATVLLLFMSYAYIATGLSTTLHFCYPVVTILMEWVCYRPVFTKRQGICCFLCAAGILLLYQPGGAMNLFGMLVALLSGVAYSVYIVYLTHSRLVEISSLKIAAWMSLFTGLEMLIPICIRPQLVMDMDGTAWALSIFLAIFITSFALLTFQAGAAKVGAAMSALLSTTEPLTSNVIGIVFLHEAVTAKSLTGITAILLSIILLVNRGGDNQEGKDVEENSADLP